MKLINKSFCFKKNILSIILYDINDAILRNVEDLIFTLIDDWNCIFVRNSLLIYMNLFMNILYNKTKENMRYNQRIMRFSLTNFWNMKSKIKS